jgi:hydrogenase maturation factor
MTDCRFEHGCITCSDEGIPVVVRALDPATGLADCEDPDGGPCEIDTTLVGAVAPGDALLAHAGVALARLEEAA